MTKYQDLKNEVKTRSLILEAEECQSCTSDDEEPHRDLKNHPWEYYYKGTAVGSYPVLSNNPEGSPWHETLRTENFTAWSMNRDPSLK